MANRTRRAVTDNGDTGNDSGGIGGANDGAGSGTASGPIIIQPDAISGSDDHVAGGNTGTGDAPKRRGRKPGSTNGKRSGKAQASLDVNGLEAIFYSLHMGVATIAKTPEIAMTQDEATMLAQATANVARHYDLGATQQTLDWGNLFSVLAMVYAPRMFAIKARMEEDKRAKNATPVNGSLVMETANVGV